MRIILVLLAASFLLSACEQRAATTAAGSPQPGTQAGKATSPSPPADSTQHQWQKLLALYRSYPLPLELSARRLENDDADRDTLNTGVAVPAALLKWLGAHILRPGAPPEVFAIARVNLAAGALGLITRVPSADSSGVASRMDFFVFNRQRQLMATYNIVEYCADDFNTFIRNATVDQEPGQNLRITIKQRTLTTDTLAGQEMTGATGQQRQDSLLVYRWQNSRFQVTERKEVEVTYGHLGTLGEVRGE